jgi:hypothetical protein
MKKSTAWSRSGLRLSLTSHKRTERAKTTEVTARQSRPPHSRQTPCAVRIEDQGIDAKSGALPGLEESLWLRPIEDRRKVDSSGEETLDGFSLRNCRRASSSSRQLAGNSRFLISRS